MGNLINKLLFEEDKGNKIITLNWNSDITKSAITQVAHCIPRNYTLENSDKTTNRSSTRQKKQPVTRKNYFLWPKVQLIMRLWQLIRNYRELYKVS